MAAPTDFDDILHVSGGGIVDDSGRYLYVAGIGPAFGDFRILIENHHAAITAGIAANAAAIVVSNANITTLQSLNAKTIDSNKSSSYTFGLAYNALLEYIILVWKSGTNVTVRVGTTSGGDELSGDTVNLNGTTLLRHILNTAYNPTTLSSGNDTGNETIYVTINGGIIDVIRLYKTNILTT